jgi:crossover junction endodeoxyribonuclease RuvC
MIVLGIDPGTLRLGWGVVASDANRLRHVAHGVIAMDGEQPLPARLLQIDTELGAVIAQHHPDVGSVETLFFHRDPQAAAKLGHARGVVLLCLSRAGVDVAEYAPARVKRTLTGHGRAEKAQVAQMIRALLSLDALPPSDAADALALAVTHHRIGPLASALRSQYPGLAAAVGAPRRRKRGR